MKWFRFAWLNTFRNKRRSIVTLLIVAMGTAAILLAGGFALYTYESLAQASARMTGHLIIGQPQQFTEDEDVPLQHGLADWRGLSKRLQADPDVRAVLPSIALGGLISNGDKSVVMMASGVDPAAEFRIKGPFLKVTQGKVLGGEAGQAQLMLGEGLARSLKAAPGTGLTLLASTVDGAMNALDATVVGVFSTGVTELDKRMVYMDLPTAQRLLNSEKVSTVGVFLDRIEKTDAAQARLAASLPDLAVRSWVSEATFYQSVRDLYNRIFGALGSIIALIVVTVVANAMSMSIVERTREVGTLRAIGTLPSQLVRSFAYEGLILGAGGAVAGALLAAGVAMALYLFPIQMPPPPGRSTGYPLFVSTDPAMFAAAILGMVLLSFLTSAWVARRTVAKPIPEALAHT